MQKKITLIAVTLAVIATAVVLIPPTDADTVQDATYYCYGDNPTLVPMLDDTGAEWSAVADDGTNINLSPDKDGNVSLDISDYDYVTVTQKVGDEVARATLIALHLPQVEEDGEYTVTYYDRGYPIGRHVIDNTTVVMRGDLFAIVPEEPSRSGYEFNGWYTTASGYTDGVFDPSVLITSDIDVYASWTSVAGTGSVQMGQYIITFDCSPGLTYTLLDSGNGRVSFTVSELPDYQVIEGSIEVEANGNPVSPVDGVYTVTGINTDVLITIDGDLMFSGNPNDPASDDGGMPMWMWIMLVVVILLIAAAILWMRGRQVDQGRI